MSKTGTVLTDLTSIFAAIPEKEREVLKSLQPSADPKQDVTRLKERLEGCKNYTSLKESLDSLVKLKGDPKYRSAKNFILLISYNLKTAEGKKIVNDYVKNYVEGVNKDKSMNNYVGYLNSERWKENEKFLVNLLNSFT